MSRKKRKSRAKRGRPGCMVRLVRLGVKLALLALLAAAVVAAWWWLTWPDVAALAGSDPERTAFIERSRKIHGDAGVRWTPVPGEAISDQLRTAVLVAEDIGFFDHRGFAGAEIRSALEDTLTRKKPLRGASTITQQLAKNLWLSPSRNPLRKLREALLTVHLERELSKQRILDLYLNCAEFGPAVFGAEAASRHFYGKPASALTAAEAAGLAAGLSRPSRWHPGCGSRSYEKHVGTIRRRMEKARGLPINDR